VAAIKGSRARSSSRRAQLVAQHPTVRRSYAAQLEVAFGWLVLDGPDFR